jgi:hypothetical protein
VALRRVALVTVAVPGAGVRITQAGAPVIRVGQPPDIPRRGVIDLVPIEFRRIIVSLIAGDVAGLAGLFDLRSRPMSIDWFTRRGTELGPIGMVRHEARGGQEFVFATMVDDVEVSALAATLREHQGWPASTVQCEHDGRLSGTVVRVRSIDHRSTSVQAAFERVADLAIACAAEEIGQRLVLSPAAG